ncbi:MAG TPA: DUF5660 domain-containing protein [Candidatus Levybacteria bacterium]|nr:DUF5660 domain-containing protein [Candidatus Levybacteria bacterium]
MAKQTTSKKQNFFADSIEAGGDQVGKQLSTLSKDTIRAMWEDFFKASAKNTLPEQLINAKKENTSAPKEAVLQEGQEFSLIAQKTEQKTVISAEHREYFQRDVQSVEIRAERVQNSENKEQVEMIKNEIRKLIKAQKEMEQAFKHVAEQVTTSSVPQEVGIYDVNFFEWVLLTIRNARMRVEEGRNWLALFASKKGQQKYWAQANKKGTSFTQHHDRAVATQTG